MSTPEPHLLHSSPRNQNSGNPSLKYFKSVVKRFASAFTFFLSSRRKSAAQNVESDGRRSTKRFRFLSFSTDVSSRSNTRSSSKWRFSYSYTSSVATSGLLGMGNFSFEEIYKATGKFSPNNKIGEGGFGTVYKGKLNDGSVVAIKRAKENIQDKNLSEFKNEIITLSKIEHLNLVRLYGYLEHEDEKIIVVEYVSNGTLREHLDGTRGDGLDMGERLDIAIDVAHAITYLHMYTDRPIIHRDIKSSNILITEKMRAKVADFGFARLASEDPTATHVSTQIKGTAGYMDPEYLRTYQLTDKSDVYSFGVLLVEMVTGRHPIETKRPISERVTTRWAMKMLKQGDAVIAMDPRLLRSPASIKAMEKVLKLANLCLGSVRQSRPSMKSCAEFLWGIRKEYRDEAFTQDPSPPPSLPLDYSHHSADFAHTNDDDDAKKRRHLSFDIEEGDERNNNVVSV